MRILAAVIPHCSPGISLPSPRSSIGSRTTTRAEQSVGLRQRCVDVCKESPFRFEVQDWLEFFKEQGWTILENRLASEEAERIKRPFPFLFPWSLIMLALPKRAQEKWRRSSGYVMYQKPILIA